MKRVALAAALLVASACARPELPNAPTVSLPSTIRIGTTDGIVTIPLETYVATTALAEIGPTNESQETVARAYEFQTIIARSYAASHLDRHARDGYELCDTTHCQVYDARRLETSRFRTAARAAADKTAGMVLMYAGRPADALFHADCGGHTADAIAVWGGSSPPYLIGSPDEVPARTHQTWQFDADVSRITAALNADPRSQVGPRLTNISVANRDPSGRAATVEVRGTNSREVRGDLFRSILNQTFGVRAILSTKFNITRRGPTYRFTGSGFGHGVGLCQVGATARARRGDSVDAILAFYYPGATLVRGR